MASAETGGRRAESDLACRLLDDGGFRNPLILAARARGLRELSEEDLPGLAGGSSDSTDAAGGPDGEERHRVIYDRNEPANIRTTPLPRASGQRGIPVEGSGRSDGGPSVRVFRSREETATAGVR